MSRARDLADLGSVTDKLEEVGNTDGALSNRNLIINGKFEVDQRLGGSSTAFSTGVAFMADRFSYYTSPTAIAAYSATHEISSDAPDGFSNSLKITCTSGGTVPATAETFFRQHIEGYNISVLNYSSANAESATVSFWIKASVTGDYGLQFTYSDGTTDHFYVSKYTVNAANTWEYKTVTIPPQTSNAFGSVTNGKGLTVEWDLGEGSTYSGPADAGWTTSYFKGLSGGVKLMGNTGATWQITGVQLERGDTATPFEHRSYGDELARCQRYFQYVYDSATSAIAAGRGASGGDALVVAIPIPVVLRTTPTVAITGAYFVFDHNSRNSATPTSVTVSNYPTNGSLISLFLAFSYTVCDDDRVLMISSNGVTTLTLDAEL